MARELVLEFVVHHAVPERNVQIPFVNHIGIFRHGPHPQFFFGGVPRRPVRFPQGACRLGLNRHAVPHVTDARELFQERPGHILGRHLVLGLIIKVVHGQLVQQTVFVGVIVAQIEQDAAVLAAREGHQNIVKLLEAIGYALQGRFIDVFVQVGFHNSSRAFLPSPIVNSLPGGNTPARILLTEAMYFS